MSIYVRNHRENYQPDFHTETVPWLNNASVVLQRAIFSSGRSSLIIIRLTFRTRKNLKIFARFWNMGFMAVAPQQKTLVVLGEQYPAMT